MRVLHIVASLSPEWCGPTKVVTELAVALAEKGIKVSIFAPDEGNKRGFIRNFNGVDIKLFRKVFFQESGHLILRFWLKH